MRWTYRATRTSDGVKAEGVIEADTRHLANLRAIDAALDALGHAEIEVFLRPTPADDDSEPRPAYCFVARYPDGEWSFAEWETPAMTPARLAERQDEARSRGCVLVREPHVAGRFEWRRVPPAELFREPRP